VSATSGPPLPTWEDLVAAARASLPPGHPAQAIFALREPRCRRRLQPALRAVGAALNLWLRNAIYRRVFRADWSELVELYAEQVVRSAAFEERARRLPPTAVRARGAEAEGSLLRRRHHQLPCTQATVQDRAQLVATLCDRGAPILLAGDDDLLSLELARAGFTDVTAIDIDPRILADIEAAARAEGLGVRTQAHDLSGPAPTALVRAYALVVMDPICTPAGLRLFLEGGLRLTQDRSRTRVLLCTHLASQLRDGLAALRTLLAAEGLALQAYLPGFGVYPNPPRLMGVARGVFRVLQGTCLRAQGIPLAATTPRYFVSDALVLRPV
jgi:hypothetical protein